MPVGPCEIISTHIAADRARRPVEVPLVVWATVGFPPVLCGYIMLACTNNYILQMHTYRCTHTTTTGERVVEHFGGYELIDWCGYEWG